MNQLDEYILSVLARMEVDDAERLEIERELRTHLEEAIGEGMQKGLSRESAEQEAIIAFDQSTAFVFPSETKLLYRILSLQQVAIFILFIVYFFFLFGFCKECVAIFISILASRIVIEKRDSRHVEVNRRLIIERFWRRPAKIEFSNICEIRFEKLHLWGQRNYVIEHLEGKALLKSDMGGIHAAAAVLCALCPDKMEAQIKEDMSRLPIRIRREPRIFKVALTLGWLIAGMGILFDLPAAWKGLAVSWGTLIGGLLLFLLLKTQERFHADRIRIILCRLIIPLAIIGYIALVGGCIIGGVRLFPAGTTILLLITIMGLLILWWRGKRITLILFAFAVSLILFASIGFLVLSRPSPAVSIPHLPVNDFTWLSNNRLLGLAKPDNSDELVIIEETGEYHRHIIPDGDWKTLPINPNGEIYLLKTFSQSGTQCRTQLSELYLLNSESGQLKQIEDYPPELNIWFMTIMGSNPWSPSGEKLVGLKYPSDEDIKTKTMVYNLVEKKSTILADSFTSSRVLWEDDNTLFGVHVDPYGDEDADQGERKIKVARIHLDRDTVDLLAEYECEDKDRVTILDGFKYALIDQPEVKEGKGLSRVEWTPGSKLLNLMTGEEIFLGAREWTDYGGGFSWNALLKRLVYIKRDEENGNKKLVIIEADIGEKIFEKKIKNSEKFRAFRFSPQGNNLVYARTRAIGHPGSGFDVGRLEILNLDTFKAKPLRGMGLMTNLIESIASDPRDFPSWSPDGEFVAYQRFGFAKRTSQWIIEFMRIENNRNHKRHENHEKIFGMIVIYFTIL